MIGRVWNLFVVTIDPIVLLQLLVTQRQGINSMFQILGDRVIFGVGYGSQGARN